MWRGMKRPIDMKGNDLILALNFYLLNRVYGVL